MAKHPTHTTRNGQLAPAEAARALHDVLDELTADLAAADSGLGFVYQGLDKLVERLELDDAVVVVDQPAMGRQAFRAGRRALVNGWAEGVALNGHTGLHTSPTIADDALERAAHLVALALRLDSLRYDSLHDPLTGLYNRRNFDDHLAQAVDRSRRYSWPFTLVMVDLDDFKVVNDNLGHMAGDAVLRAIGAEMRRALRRGDVAARIGGDEFALILPGVKPDYVPTLVRRLRGRVRELAPDQPLDFSMGAANCPSEADDMDDLCRLADERLYQAKEK